MLRVSSLALSLTRMEKILLGFTMCNLFYLVHTAHIDRLLQSCMTTATADDHPHPLLFYDKSSSIQGLEDTKLYSYVYKIEW